MFMDDSSIASRVLGPNTLAQYLRNESEHSVHDHWFDQETEAEMRKSFALPGATDSGLAWYRANVFESRLDVTTPFGPDMPKNSCALPGAPLPKIRAPTLVIWGMGDVSFDNGENVKVAPFMGAGVPLTVKEWPSTAHWVAQERPADVAREANAWFRAHGQAGAERTRAGAPSPHTN